MKTKLLILLSYIIFYSPPSLESDYSNNDFIGLIKITSEDSMGYNFSFIQVWKTNFADNTYIRSDDPDLFEEGEIYLIFISAVPNRPEILIINSNSIIYQKKDIPKETLWFLTGQPCIDPEKKYNGACARRASVNRICGCNGKEYWSECDARRDGVIKYKMGTCTD